MKRFFIIGGISIIALVIIAVLAFNILIRQPDQQVTASPIILSAEAIPLNPDDPTQNQIGRLIYRGGLLITSQQPSFGGFSDMRISDDGSKILAVSDQGFWWYGGLLHEGGRLVGLTHATLKPLQGLRSDATVGKTGDAESLVINENGLIYVGLERDHRILTYPMPETGGLAAFIANNPTSIAVRRPPADAEIPVNGGLEAMIALDPDTLLVLTEQATNVDGTLKGWLIEGESMLPISYQPHDSYSPVSLAILPNGDLMALERHYTPVDGVSARLCIIDRQQISPGAILECENIAEIIAPMSVDNFEGLSIRLVAQGGAHEEVLVYLLSDDNFNQLQDTLLMMFELAPKKDQEERLKPLQQPLQVH